jgi:hypothetical protein
MVKCGILFGSGIKFLNIISASFGLKGLTDSNLIIYGNNKSLVVVSHVGLNAASTVPAT